MLTSSSAEELKRKDIRRNHLPIYLKNVNMLPSEYYVAKSLITLTIMKT